MPTRSVATWLSYPDVRAARVALAAGSLAGLVVLGACSEGTVATKVAGPAGPTVSEPVFHTGVVGANSHEVQVCIDPASAPGTYTFAVTHNTTLSGPLELPAPAPADPVIAGVISQTFGPYSPGDVITAAPSIVWDAADILGGVPECVTVFARNATATHANNRLFEFAAPIGLFNPWATVNIDLVSSPAGYTYTATCVNDDAGHPQTANCATAVGGIVADPIYSSANIFHGSVVTYKFIAQTVTGGSATVGDVKFNKSGPTTFSGRFRVANTAGGQPIHVNSVTVTLFRTGGGTSTQIPLSSCTISPSSFTIPQSGSQTVDVSCTRQTGTFSGGQEYKAFISVDVNGGQNSPYTNNGSFKG